MNVYLIKRKDTPSWDEYRAFVVVAKDKKEAFGLIKNSVDMYWHKYIKMNNLIFENINDIQESKIILTDMIEG